MQRAVVGVDVGTGSARAGLFTLDGRRLASAARPIRMWRDLPGHAEQSSGDIWHAIRAALAEALAAAGPVDVIGIGFDATCSLVAVDAAGGPVAVNAAGDAERDTIVWLDHRALAEADHVNRVAGEIGSEVTRYVGGRISLEMQVPKLLWLKRHVPGSWDRAHRLFDLPDWLTWRATGADSRSLCSTVCKWTYLGHAGLAQGGGWDAAFFEAIGLGDLAREQFARIGNDIRPMGAPVGDGLSARAAMELGLPEGIAVGTSAIDAHAGGIGTVGATIEGDSTPMERRLALICGTSSCHMAVSAEPRFVPGVWGPYYSAMVPGLWLNEGGQSATGALLDHVVESHAAGSGLGGAAAYPKLNARLAELSGTPPAALTNNLHVLPDHHGNRSPRADATLRGAIDGLTLAAGLDELALEYLATVQGLAYGTRHILAAMAERGYDIETIVACGGLTKNEVFLREHADATGCPIALPEEPDAVLLGSAVLGAVAAGVHADIPAAMAAMTRAKIAVRPAGGATRAFHDAKYAVFLRMHDDQLAYRALMAPTMVPVAAA